MIDKEATVAHISQDWGIFGDFHGLDNVQVSSVFKHDYEEFCFCFAITESPCLMSASCEIICVQQETTKAESCPGVVTPLLEWGLTNSKRNMVVISSVHKSAMQIKET